MLEINFCVLFSAGPVGLRFTGPSAKLLITYINFKFLLDVCRLCLQVNKWNCFSYSGILYKTRRTFCFPFRQTSAICIYSSMSPGNRAHACSFGRSRCFRTYCTFAKSNRKIGLLTKTEIKRECTPGSGYILRKTSVLFLPSSPFPIMLAFFLALFG